MKIKRQFLMVLIILMFAAVAAQSMGMFSGPYDPCTTKETAGFALVPYYGYYSCEPTTYTPIYNSLQLPAKDSATVGGTTVVCGDDEFVKDSCGAVSVYCVGGNEVVFQFDGATDCFIGSDDWCTMSITPNVYSTIATKMEITERIKFRGCRNKGWFTAPYVSGTVKNYYIPYGLYTYVRGGKTLVSSTNCNVPWGVEQCVDCVVPSIGTDSGVATVNNNPVSKLVPDSTSTYVKDWLMSPIKSATVMDTDGKEVYCSNNMVYNIGTVRTEMGCALIPGSVKRSVTCCPGDKLTAYTYCGMDFTWKTGDMGCIVGGVKSVVNCNGGGKWYTTASLTYQKATACNDDGTCSYDTMTAPCAPPNIGCPLGSTCVVDVNNPANNKCMGGIEPCGDKDKDCYDDCTHKRIEGCVITDETCVTDADCDDDNWLTLDNCEGYKVVGIDTGLNKKCVHADMTWVLFVVGGIILLFFMLFAALIIGGGSVPLKKR